MKLASVNNETPDRAPEPNWQALFDAFDEELGLKIKPFTVIFVSEDKIRQLNKKYRDKDSDTNILSFEDIREIYICPKIVKNEAKKGSVDYGDWMTRIIVHGILHLEGYLHDSGESALKMESLERKVLTRLGVSVL